MSLFETKTIDNFIYESQLENYPSLSNETPFLEKKVSWVTDQQAGSGSYTSGEVIIDTQSVSASGGLIDWRNAYITVPLQSSWDLTWGGPAGTITAGANAKFALALKNCSLLDSIKVEANGKTILTATQGLAKLVNFKLLSTMTPASLLKEGATIGFYPDEIGTTGDNGADYWNVANDITANVGINSSGVAADEADYLGDSVIPCNRGLVERQSNFIPNIATTFQTAENARNEAGTWDYGLSIIGSTDTQRPVDLRYVAVIRLKDISDLFDKHPLSRGLSYRVTLKFNQAQTTVTHSAATSWSSSLSTSHQFTTSQTSGNCQPVQFCIGIGTKMGRAKWTNSVTATSVITHKIDNGSDTTNGAAPAFTGVRMYIPSYTLDPVHQERLLAENPIVKRNFLDYQLQTTQTYTLPGQRINVQVSTSVTNPKALVVVPRWSQVATGGSTKGQGFYSEKSPYTTSPGTPDPFLSLTNFQIKVGNNYILSDRLYYTFQQFMENVAPLFAVNGDQSVLTSGLITKKSFDTVHRYYAFDLSRYPEAMDNLPQMISLECDNNSAVSVELECFLLYGREAEWNLANGSASFTA